MKKLLIPIIYLLLFLNNTHSFLPATGYIYITWKIESIDDSWFFL